MKLVQSFASFCLFASIVSAQSVSPLTAIQVPTEEQAAHLFVDPPSIYGPDVYYGLDNATYESIPADLDRIKALGFRAVTFQAGRQMPSPYLSEGYFKLVQFLVSEAAKRDLRVWIVDDGGYPSGFAGGKFSSDAPSLRMQALTVTNSIDLTPGQEFEDVMSSEFVGAVAYDLDSGRSIPLIAVKNHIRFTPPVGHWRVLVVDHKFRTSLTRSITNPTGAKDASQSLENYLDPVATRQYLAFEHEQYKKAVGASFGSTILGFRGDEPDFSFFGLPYTPGILAEFQRRKGYDIQPWIASLFLPKLSPELLRIRADYTDVWSMLFRENFFKLQADWCAANHLEYQVHINHEDDLPRLAVTEGDYLRNLTAVQVPGVDTIWHQIWKDATPDFPKLASSAAHLSGHPQAFTESLAAYRPTPTLEDARFILNEQIVRGINLIEIMHYPFGTHIGSPMADPGWSALMNSVRRTTALLSQGRPTASIGLYLPSMALWTGNVQANTALLALAKKLDESQRDYDFIDDDSIVHALKLEGGSLQTASGNAYSSILVPDGSLLSVMALRKLAAFSASGGHVVFFGHLPSEAADKTIRNPVPAPSVTGAVLEPSQQLTSSVIAALPVADLHSESSSPHLRYIHRKFLDADLYFLFNEGVDPISSTIHLKGNGVVEQWSAEDGGHTSVKSRSVSAYTISLRLNLSPYASKIIVIHSHGS